MKFGYFKKFLEDLTNVILFTFWKFVCFPMLGNLWSQSSKFGAISYVFDFIIVIKFFIIHINSHNPTFSAFLNLELLVLVIWLKKWFVIGRCQFDSRTGLRMVLWGSWEKATKIFCTLSFWSLIVIISSRVVRGQTYITVVWISFVGIW